MTLSMTDLPLGRINSLLNDLATQGRAHWPSPVSRWMGDLMKEAPEARAMAVEGFLDSTTSFLGSILITQYINGAGYPNEKLNRAAFDFLCRPLTLGRWVEVLRDGLEHFEDQPDFALPELIRFANGLPDPLDTNPGSQAKIAFLDLMGELNAFRKCVGHPGYLADYLRKQGLAPGAESKIGEMYELARRQYLPRLIQLLMGIQFLSAYRLFFVRSYDPESHLAEIFLYLSDRPRQDQIKIAPELIRRWMPEGRFDEDLFRHRLLFGRVTMPCGDLLMPVVLDRVMEMNPVTINMLSGKEYLPYRFQRWVNKKKRTLAMQDILSRRGAETVHHMDTQTRLWEAYQTLRKLLNRPAEEGDEEDLTGSFLTLSHSRHRFDVVREEVYPDFEIAEGILSGITLRRPGEEIPSQEKLSLVRKTRDEAAAADSHEAPPKPEGESSAPAASISRLSLGQAMERLWETPEKWHGVLIGEGGQGKTTSLLKVWEWLLAGREPSPVPIFVRLEAYNHVRAEKRREFLWYAIAQEYHGRVPAPEEVRALENQFLRPLEVRERVIPSAILLLDGFDEVTVDRAELIQNINEIRMLRGAQILISSRRDMRRAFNWNDFNSLALEPLADQQVHEFLIGRGVEAPRDLLKEIPLLRNPMMLALYCGIERELSLSRDKPEYAFLPVSRTKGAILHNFIVSSLARQDRIVPNPDEGILNRIHLLHLLPRIGYEMACEGVSSLEHAFLMNLIKDELGRYSDEVFLDLHPELAYALTGAVQERLKPDVYSNRIDILHALRERHCMLMGTEGKRYGFINRDFRDYFAAAFIRERTREYLRRSDAALKEWARGTHPPPLSRMLWELMGGSGDPSGDSGGTTLDRALSLLRGVKLEEGDRRLHHILSAYRSHPDDLRSADLRGLDLSRIPLQGARLGLGIGSPPEEGADLTGCSLSKSGLYPQGHEGGLHALQYSSDGHRIVSVSAASEIKVWDAESGFCENTFAGSGQAIHAVALDPRSSRIAFGEDDGTVKILSPESGECSETFRGLESCVYALSFSRDGGRLAMAAMDGNVCIRDLSSGECVEVSVGLQSYVHSIAFDADLTRVASGAGDRAVRIWDAETGDCLRTCSGQELAFPSVAFSPDGRRLAAGSDEGTIRVWSVRTSERLTTCSGHRGSVFALAFHPGGQRLASAGEDGTVRIWDVETGECLRVGRGHPEGAFAVSFDPEGGRLVSGGAEGTLQILDSRNGDLLRRIGGLDRSIRSVALHPDGRKLAWGDAHGSIRVWDLNKNRSRFTCTGHRGRIRSVTYSHDGKILASAGNDKTLRIWDSGTGELLHLCEGHTETVRAVSFYMDGTRISTASDDRTIRIWDIASGHCLRTCTGKEDWLPFAVFSPGGRRIASESGEEIVNIWDTETGECLWIRTDRTEWILSLTFAHKDSRVAAGNHDGDVKIWDSKTGECMMTLEGHDEAVYALAFAPSGDHLATADETGRIILWETGTGEILADQREAHAGAVNSLVFDPSGAFIATGGNDGTARLWLSAALQCVTTVQNLPRLFIGGVAFGSSLEDSGLDDEDVEILQRYRGFE